MLRFYADFFVKALWKLNEMEIKWYPNNGIIPEAAAIAANIVGFEADCAAQGLLITAQKCARIREKCHSRQVTFREIVTDLKDLRERQSLPIQDEPEEKAGFQRKMSLERWHAED
jgi:hypothetical protein